jgi:hypothetical protein
MKLFIWYGHRILGYDTITLHTNKSHEAVIGITFGSYQEKDLDET